MLQLACLKGQREKCFLKTMLAPTSRGRGSWSCRRSGGRWSCRRRGGRWRCRRRGGRWSCRRRGGRRQPGCHPDLDQLSGQTGLVPGQVTAVLL
jgi:hypothetical protein